MTQPLVDPYEAFWAHARNVTSGELTGTEEGVAQDLTDEAGRATQLAEVALVLAGAFWLYRAYMRRRVAQQLASVGRSDPGTLQLAITAVWQTFTPRFVAIIAPALVRGYLIGIRQAKAGTVPEDYLHDIAESYARGLGEHLNQVSAEAMVAGYTAQLNRKVPPARALEQVLGSFGVTPRTMNALVAVWNTEDPKRLTHTRAPSVRADRAQALIAHDLSTRAKTVGDNEAWAARTGAKQILWSYGVARGMIPPGARRVWKTTHGEKTCTVCGPLNRVEVAVNDQFQTGNGPMWTPPAHPHCRCDVELEFNAGGLLEAQHQAMLAQESVAKADEPAYKRDTKGRFAEVNTLGRKPFKDPRPMDPTLARLLREAQIKYSLDTAAQATDKQLGRFKQLGNTKALGQTKQLGQTQLGATELSGQQVSARQLTGKRLAARQIRADIQQMGTGLPKTWSSGLHPNYFKFDQPVFSMMERWETDVNSRDPVRDGVLHVQITPERQFTHELLMVDRLVEEHWQDVIDETLADLPSRDEDMVSISVPDPRLRNGRAEAQVNMIDVENALWHYVADDNTELNKFVEADFVEPDGTQGYYSITNRQIAEHFGAKQMREENMPVVAVMHWGFADVTEEYPGKNGYVSNPGNWKIATYDTKASNYFHRIILEPPD